jgi:hypothetical protein
MNISGLLAALVTYTDDAPATTAPGNKLSLSLISKTLLVPMRLHALAALVLGNFSFASFLERAHSDFQIGEPRFNHLIHCIATQFLFIPNNIAMHRAN